MKLFLVIITCLICISCGKTEYLTVEETVRQCKVCDSAGLFFVILKDWKNNVVSVQCRDYRFDGHRPIYAKIKNGDSRNE